MARLFSPPRTPALALAAGGMMLPLAIPREAAALQQASAASFAVEQLEEERAAGAGDLRVVRARAASGGQQHAAGPDMLR